MEIKLPDDFKEFLKLLNEHGVEYLLIGGYAVGYYGYPRAIGNLFTNFIFYNRHNFFSPTYS